MEQPDGHAQVCEGRLLAQRRVLARLLALLSESDWQGMAGWLAERQVLHDGQEDPGAVPAEGMAQELAMSAEFRELAELAARYRHGDG
ncbi:hypothetical protein [uncultured Paracoccus sp.]|uniref:hypothetical protein n=1 Tax=uncultured Paracoccus sp. TaxID=189685 RepID=UPI0025D6A793|nr:hypothetical protein [uncultured Paracoccus sp.]